MAFLILPGQMEPSPLAVPAVPMFLLLCRCQLYYSNRVLGHSQRELLLNSAQILGVGYHGFSVAYAVTVASESSKWAWTAALQLLSLGLGAGKAVQVSLVLDLGVV